MSLYLKYRPSDFTSLVGQNFIKETLQKAIEQNKTVGAYLFTGPRGTGKTSTARIFAKALNCKNPQSGNPCLSCDICSEFQAGGLIDIIEIDAASYTGVDNIREIIEKAQFQPTKTRYKVYIIDEVHMLSKGAFNALLKILEEPPAHVKFILATTEIHKVPETILSRCQRYDFKNISEKDMADRLRFVAKEEHIELEQEALEYIVKQAQGGLRNALSLLEQLTRDNKVDYATIEATLGIGKQEEIFSFFEKLFSQDITVLDDFEALKSQGKNLKLFFRDILFLGRDRAVSAMKEGKHVGNILRILEEIQEAGIKAKGSFDESTSYLLAVMRLIAGSEIQAISTSSSHKTETPKAEKISPPPAPSAKEALSISHEEIAGIFDTGEADFESSVKKVSPSPASTPSALDLGTLANTVKKLGAKAALTMSLRGANIYEDVGIYILESQSKIAKATFEVAENQALIGQALEEMLGREISFKIR